MYDKPYLLLYTLCVYLNDLFINLKNGWFNNLLCKYKVVYKLESVMPYGFIIYKCVLYHYAFMS